MATLQFRNGSSRLLFQYEGKQQTLNIGDVGLAEARQWKSKAENLLMRVKQRMLEVPLGCSIQEFILHEGKPPLDLNVAKPRNITFDQLWDAYIKVYSNGAVEKNTLRTAKIHRKHLETTLGKSFLMPALTTGKLQEHIDRRCKLVGPITIKKEIDSFRAVWNWGKSDSRVTGDFPAAGLVYPKSEEKLPFMDWAEIERRVSAGGDADKLWECLYLKEDEVEEFMQFAEKAASPDYMHPMLMTAAHAGARRSEMMRARLEDVDLANAKLTIREKKRKRGAYTTRRVDMSKKLVLTLKKHMKRRQGVYLFGDGEKELTDSQAYESFVALVKETKWSVLKGFHILRHAFISALACNGIDQRIIDGFVGHTTEEQRLRYRHLFPQVTQNAISKVFG
jgi:integrase